ncbi:MAG TPA: ERAP1-like C-terminal domain-containing protein, partial [Pedococcus sp.]|nr:ERAP1-like C-terminal domain-containing protein [Pedococcus sp.]
VVPNASDLTWATLALDPQTVAALPTALAQVPDGQARAVVWVALIDSVCLGTVDPRDVVRTFASAWPHESSDSVLNRVATSVLGRLVPTFLPAAEQDSALEVVATAARALLATAEPGSSRALLAARTLARSSDDQVLLHAWADGQDLPPALVGDSDFRWIVIRNLASRGLVEREDIERFHAQDDTLQGRLGALTAAAALPGAEAKAWAWAELTTNRDRSNYELNALAQGFWSAPGPQVLRPYVARYFEDVPAMTAWVGEDALARVASLAYPGRVVESETLEASQSALAGPGLSPAVRRAMVDGESELREALASRALYG